VLHVHGSGHYLQDPAKRALWSLIALSCLGLVVWVRLLRPLLLARRPWRVTAVRRERGRSWTLTLKPEKGEPPAYRAGQFAWLTLRASPLALREHPFSFSSSPTCPGAVEFTIKELGDFTSTIGQTRVGDVAWVDGPYGNFTTVRHPDAPGFVFVAGGVGIAPIVSMLRSMADTGERRPLWLFYGNRVREGIVFREEIEELQQRLDLRVVHTLAEADADWTGERGLLTREMFARHLHGAPPEVHWFVCGPEGMIRVAEDAAQAIGVAARRVHSEIFDLA
jgi:predicted ferric reductase